MSTLIFGFTTLESGIAQSYFTVKLKITTAMVDAIETLSGYLESQGRGGTMEKLSNNPHGNIMKEQSEDAHPLL